MMNAECRWCGSKQTTIAERVEGPHFAAVHCAGCGAFHGWLPRPDRPKRRRASRHRNLVAKYGARTRDQFGGRRCEMCRTPECELDGWNLLEAHHVVPLMKGGDSRPENVIIICRQCHKLIHLQQDLHRAVDAFIGRYVDRILATHH